MYTDLSRIDNSDISTQEVLIRTHEIAQPPSTASHLGNISDLVSRLKDQAVKKEERRLVQMRTAREKSRKERASRAAASAVIDKVDNDDDKHKEEEGAPSKRQKVEAEAGPSQQQIPQTQQPSAQPQQHRRRDPEQEVQSLLAYSHPQQPLLQWDEPTPIPPTTILTKPSPEMRGHTSYLTFASFPPALIREQLAAQSLAEKDKSRSRLSKLKKEAGDTSMSSSVAGDVPTPTATETGTDYGSDGMDEVMGTLTEEEMIALAREG